MVNQPGICVQLKRSALTLLQLLVSLLSTPGDAVDVWFKHGWWKGTYQREEPNDDADLLHSVFMDYMPQGQQVGHFTTENIRIHQDFYFDDPTNYFGVWAYHHK